MELIRLCSGERLTVPTFDILKKSEGRNTAKVYSPLFVRAFAKNHTLPVSAKSIKRRHSERFENRDTPLRLRAMASPAQVLSPGALPEPVASPRDDGYEHNLNIQVTCPECKEIPANIIEEFSSGDLVCGSCGLVLGDRIVDTRSEWRTFSNDDQGSDDPSRVGEHPNLLLNGSQLQTSISFGDGGNRSRDLHRTQLKTTQDPSTKNLLQAYKEIGAYCDAHSMNTVAAETAKYFYKLTEDARAFRGKSREVVIAGCILLASRHVGAPRSFREIFESTRVPKKEIGQIFKKLEKFFKEKNVERAMTATPLNYEATATTKPEDLCNRFCNQLVLSHQTTEIATTIAKRMASVGALAGRSPLSAASACIYMASHLMNQPKSPKEISAVAHVSDGTIRTAYKLLYADKDKLIDPEWLKKGGDMKRLPQG